MKKALVLGALLVLAVCGCDNRGTPKKISLKEKEAVESADINVLPPIRIAVGGMITPREGFSYYRKMLDYIGGKLGRHVEFVDREDYAEINRLVKEGKVDVAFVCGGPYVDGHDEFGMELLAAPVAYGGTVYYSYIIVHKDSPAKSIGDLRGKTFAFTQPLSNTGKLVPTYMLAKMGESPDSFFRKYEYTNAHDKSIQAVADKLVDGAAVDSLIWEYANRINPEYTSKTRIIEKSPPYGIPPVAVHPGFNQGLKERIKNIFLNAHLEAEGKAILEGMMIEKFVELDDKAYDSIREMKDWIERQKKAGAKK